MPKRKSNRSTLHFFQLFPASLSEFLKNDPLRMAGATAFFTTFALPPILVILIQVLGLIFKPQNIRSQLFLKLSGIIGSETVDQIVKILNAFRELAQNRLATIAGFIFLLFVATTLFKVIKSSINQLWKIRRQDKEDFLEGLKARLHSVAVIIIAGILFVISLTGEGVQAFLSQELSALSPTLTFYFNSFLNYSISILTVTAWFSVVFRYLPDSRITWKSALTGGFITSILFNLGKIILHWLLQYNNITTIYGASASIVLLLLFVFYSSLILYYGASFTKTYIEYKGESIKTLHHSAHYTISIEHEQPKESKKMKEQLK